MTYIFVDFEGFKIWFEVDKEGTALRQVTIEESSGIIEVSCLGPFLADQYVDTQNDCETITREQFESVWQEATAVEREKWHEEKLKYVPGMAIQVTIQYFYPQGTICRMGDRLFCANIKTTYLHGVSLGTGANILGTITGYDEPNMWILLDNCQNA
ncbi:hypothetical protein [Escherichia coli]|uniref:hypothetical protein n=1 Tax=Escherichia coli TaxID=562 RepID=UPI0004A137C1|nr:hypothetical protein [Escherichia coli]EGP5910267.1 hypothetical protein [Escherichia coli]EGP5919425.1 hypothetical protein [Escherichia coli]EHL1107985.1 hypothetical protein [Escherichia coli]EIH4672084.1 hypothetical protein [Escherichia coli]ELO4949479.1 hypothetical protein [Escherichia coli]